MPSPLVVEMCYAKKIEKHPNADRLDVITVKGWQCVTKRGTVDYSDLLVYIPIDSVLPKELEREIFGDSKITLKNGRVRTIKIRGAISQGLIVPGRFLMHKYDIPLSEGADASQILGITKYAPPEKPPFIGGKQPGKKQINPNFSKYTKINHLKNYPDIIDRDTEIVVTEKIHGTNFRAGYAPIYSDSKIKYCFKWLRSLFTKHTGYEFVYGSHNVQLQDTPDNDKTRKNVYSVTSKQYDLRNILQAGEVIYGEIYGDGIQKNYKYGLNNNNIALIVFDIQYKSRWLDYAMAYRRCQHLNLDHVPVLVKGRRSDIDLDDYISGPSRLDPFQHVREGIVVKPIVETSTPLGRTIYKYINPEYLLQRGNTEYS